VQETEVLRNSERAGSGRRRGQHDAEVVVAQIRGEVVADDAAVAFTRATIEDADVENLDDGKRSPPAVSSNWSCTVTMSSSTP
jgi:hypothetical protein